MTSRLSRDDPNVAVWKIDNFAERVVQNYDEWASELYAMKHPEFGNVEFYLRLVPKNSNCSSITFYFVEGPENFSARLNCEVWFETVNEKQTESKNVVLDISETQKFKRVSFLSYEIIAKLSNYSSAVFLCFRLSYPVRSLGTISKKTTFYRWTLNNFASRFDSAVFQNQWTSDKFTVEGLNGVKFRISFYPKGFDEISRNSCGLFLHVDNLGTLSIVRAQYELWIRSPTRRLHKKILSENFIKICGWGTSEYTTQQQVLELSQEGLLEICCNIRPILDVAHSIAILPFSHELEAFFDSDVFCDAATIRVGDKTFKVAKIIICSKSPVFYRMFVHQTKERGTGIVEIDDLDAEMVELMLRYMYGGRVQELRKVASELLVVADRYEVEDLIKLCTNSILQSLCIENVLIAMKLAYHLDHLSYFKKHVLEFAQDNKNAICGLDEFENAIRTNSEAYHHFLLTSTTTASSLPVTLTPLNQNDMWTMDEFIAYPLASILHVVIKPFSFIFSFCC